MQALFYSVGEVASVLNVSQKWVYKHIGKWDCAFKIEGRWFIDKKRFFEWIKSNAQPTKPAQPTVEDRHGLT